MVCQNEVRQKNVQLPFLKKEALKKGIVGHFLADLALANHVAQTPFWTPLPLVAKNVYEKPLQEFTRTSTTIIKNCYEGGTRDTAKKGTAIFSLVPISVLYLFLCFGKYDKILRGRAGKYSCVCVFLAPLINISVFLRASYSLR